MGAQCSTGQPRIRRPKKSARVGFWHPKGLDKELLVVAHYQDIHHDERTAGSLISLGANINARYYDGSTPLILAAWAGRVDMCRLLMSRGANVNLANDLGYTPLIRAAGSGLLEICQELLARGAHVDAFTYRGDTALLAAIAGDHDEVCYLLLEAGASVNATTAAGMYPLRVAARRGRDRLCNKLLEYGAGAGDFRDEILRSAASCGMTAVCMKMVAAGANVNAANEYSQTPLLLAMLHRYDQTCRALVAYGASVNAMIETTGGPQRPAHHRSSSSSSGGASPPPVNGVRRTGAWEYVPVQRKQRATPLMLAAERGLAEMCATLVEYGADVNTVNSTGQTALAIAVACQQRMPTAAQSPDRLGHGLVDGNGEATIAAIVCSQNLNLGIGANLTALAGIDADALRWHAPYFTGRYAWHRRRAALAGRMKAQSPPMMTEYMRILLNTTKAPVVYSQALREDEKAERHAQTTRHVHFTDSVIEASYEPEGGMQQLAPLLRGPAGG